MSKSLIYELELLEHLPSDKYLLIDYNLFMLLQEVMAGGNVRRNSKVAEEGGV